MSEPSLTESFGTLDINIVVAIVGLGAAIIGAISNILLSTFMELNSDRERKRQSLEVYRSYADPIALAASALFWRLREIVVDERNEFLIIGNSLIEFDKYKFNSTMYRLAALIAWLRAYRRELMHFSLTDPYKLKDLKSTIDKFEDVLAQGSHVEQDRVKNVFSAFGITVSDKNGKFEKYGRDLDRVLQKALLNKNRGNTMILLDEKFENERQELCQFVRKLVLDNMEGQEHNNVDKNWEDSDRLILSALSIREAWLYRDYQVGLGDILIREVSGGVRRFEVIGYGDFEALVDSTDVQIQKWMNRLREVFLELDFSQADSDARVVLISDTLKTTARLLQSLSNIDGRRQVVSKKTLNAVKDVLA